MKSQAISLIKPNLRILSLFLFISCNSQNNQLKQSQIQPIDFDSCSVAKPFENTGITQGLVKPDYTGVLNNYWGEDTTKLDFQHFFENGKLIKSIFYYKNGNIQEEYTYKCGALHGIQKYFYDNGKLAKTIPFSYGYRQGTGNLYDENGKLRQEVTFVADSLVGKPKSFNEKGELTTP